MKNRMVQDLTSEELNELKQSYVSAMAESADEELEVYWSDLAEAPETVSDDEVFEYYDGMTFSEDDFFLQSGRLNQTN